MKNCLVLLFSILTHFAYAQSNSIIFYAGPEFYFPVGTAKRDVVPGVITELQFSHQLKNGIGIQTGVMYKHVQYNFHYQVDSTPLPHPVNDLNSAPFRYYNRMFHLDDIGSTFKVNYKIKISQSIYAHPSAGINLGFDIVNKYSSHFYVVDTTGISDPGPYFSEYNDMYYQSPLLPDKFSLELGCSFNYTYLRRVSFVVFPAATITWDFEGSYFLSKFSLPCKFGIVYRLS